MEGVLISGVGSIGVLTQGSYIPSFGHLFGRVSLGGGVVLRGKYREPC